SELNRINKRSSDHFKRECRSAAFRNISAFKQAGAWIQQCSVKSWNVHRRLYPYLSCVRKLQLSVPVGQLGYVKLAAVIHLIIDHKCYFAASQPISHCKRIISYKGLKAILQHIAFNRNAIQWIDTIQYNQFSA